MLAIRLSRVGKKGQPFFRIIVQEKTLSPKKKATDIVGHYAPSKDPAEIVIKEDRVKEWISKGAQPSDTVAMLLKKKGFAGMEKFMAPRDKQRKSSKDAGKEAAPAAA
jgi:small subunit ribosomal protein S16